MSRFLHIISCHLPLHKSHVHQIFYEKKKKSKTKINIIHIPVQSILILVRFNERDTRVRLHSCSILVRLAIRQAQRRSTLTDKS